MCNRKLFWCIHFIRAHIFINCVKGSYLKYNFLPLIPQYTIPQQKNTTHNWLMMNFKINAALLNF